MRSRDGGQDQEIAPMSPDPFLVRGGVWERDYLYSGHFSHPIEVNIENRLATHHLNIIGRLD